MIPTLGCRRRSSRGASRRPAPPGRVWLALCLVIAAGTAPAAGQDYPRLELGTPSVHGDHVWLQVTVVGLLQGDVLDALHAGLPATVLFEWRVWQKRPGLWDRQIGSGATAHRVFYDVLQNRYNLFDYRGRPIASSDKLPEIERAISDMQGLKLSAASELSADRTYYVEVHAGVELLDDEEIDRLNEWLTGADRERKRFDIVESVSGRLSRALGRIIGPESRTAVGRTADFAGFPR